MQYTRNELIWVLRNAANCWRRYLPEYRIGGQMNVPAVKGMMLATCGVINSGIGEEEKKSARYFERQLERREQESLLDEALALYRAA